MIRKILTILVSVLFILLALAACRKTYFHVVEEVRGGNELRFTKTDSYYQHGRSIELTQGRYRIGPGDSLMLYIEGRAKTTGVGESGVMELEFTETARIYMILPPQIYEETYGLRHNSICEILNNTAYHSSENIFTCQSGQVIVDSIRNGDVFGTFKAEYVNTSNKSLKAYGPFRAKQK